jgi:hypothetical protein
VARGWGTLHNKLHNLYASPNVIRVIKSKRMRWLGPVARMGEMRNAYNNLVGKPRITTASKTALGPTQPPIEWVPGALSLGVSGRGVKLITHLYLVQRSKNEWSYTSTPPIRLHGVVLS